MIHDIFLTGQGNFIYKKITCPAAFTTGHVFYTYFLDYANSENCIESLERINRCVCGLAVYVENGEGDVSARFARHVLNVDTLLGAESCKL